MAARVGFTAVVFLIVGSVYVGQYAIQDLLSVASLAKIGRGLFLTWAGSLFVAVVLITPVLVGQAVLDEKEEHTLELLAITRITPRRILWGTLLSRLVMMESLILAVTPVLALVLGFGGVGLLEMVNAIVQANVVMLVAGTVATFVALYSRSVIIVILHTWFWLFMSQTVSGMLLAAGGGAAMMLATPFTAFGAVAGQTGVSPWLALIVPTMVWGSVAFAVMHVTTLCFDTLALGEKEANQADADLSSAFWRLNRFQRRMWPSLFLLVLLSPLLLLPRFASGYVLVLPEILSLAWFTAFLSLGAVMHLLSVRKGSLKRALAAQKRLGRRTSWGRMSRHFEQRDREEASEPPRDSARGPVAEALRGSRTRAGKLLSPLQRKVWDWPVIWRETVTAAHGRTRRVLVGWYVGFGGMMTILGLSGGLEEPMVALGLGFFGLSWLPMLTLLLATSSIVGERRARTLELLCVTPMSGGRIVWSKVSALGLLLGPGYLLGALLIVFGMLAGKVQDGPTTVLSLAWFFVINLVIALLCMWRALEVKTPSRAWAGNLVLVVATAWMLAALTGALGGLSLAAGIFKPLMSLWAIIVPFGILSVDEDLFPLYLLISSGFWMMWAAVLAYGATRAMRRRASGV